MEQTKWILCPVCQSKTRTQIRGDTELKNFPLFCPKCKQETLISVTATITMCVQPLGQIAYGFLFDGFSSAVYLVLIPTGIIVCLIGIFSTGFFKKLEIEQTATK